MTDPISLNPHPESATSGSLQSLTSGILVAIVALAAMLHTVMIVNAPPLQSANDRSRWCTIRALVESGTYRIDTVRENPGWDTIDLIRKDGHFYSTKPPLMSTWVAGIVSLLTRATGWSFQSDLARINAATLLLTHGLPFLVGLMGLAWWLGRSSLQPWVQVFVLLTASFGTLLSPFLTSLNNHAPAAFGVMLAMLCWLSGPAANTWKNGIRFAIWGFAASWSACHDLPAAAFTLAMLCLAWRERPSLTALGFLPAAAIPALGFLLCNWFALESFIPAYSGYGGETYRFLHEGVPSYWLQPQGIDRNLDSPLVYLLNCTFGHHGWWLLTPVWILCLVPGAGTNRPARSQDRNVARLTIGLSLIVLTFYMLRTENYNYGGVSCGLRWAIFLIPLWIFWLSGALDRLPPGKLWRGTALIGLCVSVFSAWYPMSRPWQQPWSYQIAEAWGAIAPRDPPAPFERSLYSWLADLPQADQSEGPVWVEYRRELPPGGEMRMRVTFTGIQRVGSRECAVVEFTQRTGQDAQTTHTLLIDRQAFLAGKPSAECLVWADPRVTPERQQSDLTWYRGLPLVRAYNPGYERYLKTRLRVDALACQRAAAQVDAKLAPDLPPARFRCDVWLSPEVPFGTARVEWTISDPHTGDVQQRETWEAIACHPPISPKSPVTVEMFAQPRSIVSQLRDRLQLP